MTQKDIGATREKVFTMEKDSGSIQAGPFMIAKDILERRERAFTMEKGSG